jgi:hypothetical protein
MIEKFWEKIGENIAGEWDLRKLGPALAFWGGGLLLWVIQGNLSIIYAFFQLSLAQAGITIILVFLLIFLSNLAISSLTLSTLRLFEGYWTPDLINQNSWLRLIWPFRYLQSGLAQWMYKKWEKSFEGEYQRLAGRFSSLNDLEAQRYAHLDAELLTDFPKNKQLFLPTRLGNLIRASEEYPQYWYGLQAGITWPRLWLVLPESVQKEISEARKSLDSAITWMVWAILFSAWVGNTGFAVVISLLTAFIAFHKVYASAMVYGEMIRSAYDLYRFSLYKCLGWPLPETPEDEREQGESLTLFLRRRISSENFSYETQDEKK